MTIWEQALLTPDKPAIIVEPAGDTLSYAQLADRSLRLASFIAAAGLRTGDAAAVWMRNSTWYHALYFAAMRTGVYLVPVNANLTPGEAAYIINDADVKLLFAHPATARDGTITDLLSPDVTQVSIGGDVPGFTRLEPELSALGPHADTDVVRGAPMFYSSGTTGRPKGIKRAITGVGYAEGNAFERFLQTSYGMTQDTVILCPGPSYHSLPLMYPAGALDAGGTAVIMERFDPAVALDLLERHQATMSLWVPTMLKRMLSLPADLRSGRELERHHLAFVSGAPCPPEVKLATIRWWGPIVTELYGASEPYGITRATAEEWLARRGTVGRAIMGVPHVCDVDGTELPVGMPGRIYFDVPQDFEYHKDPEKSRRTRHPVHPTWRCIGDIGYLDKDGYLFITDRESNMIVSGGVNIYPQEIEDALIDDPLVQDAAVIGVPDDDLGEIAQAVVVLNDATGDVEAAQQELLAVLAKRFARYKLPRRWMFVDTLPRQDNGKLYKRLLAKTAENSAPSSD
ncbi:AMP-binding protein [Nocardia sp. NPDC004278]